jgi:hypothetical protein
VLIEIPKSDDNQIKNTKPNPAKKNPNKDYGKRMALNLMG